MKADKILYPGISLWLLLLIPVILAGFYPTYLAKLPGSMGGIIHIHTLFMSCWLILAITQPMLIRKKKIRWHRTLGKLSYVVMPLVLFFGYMVIRFSYLGRIDRAGGTGADIATLAFIKSELYIPIIYLAWLAVFYILAVSWRRRMIYHATFMFAAILTMLGPSVDRIIFQVYEYYDREFDLFAEVAVFVLIDILLLGLLYYHWRNNYPIRAAALALSIYLIGQLGYFLLPKTQGWQMFVTWIMV